MKYKISCSFGEIIDKVTILRIKLNNIKNKSSLENINLELETIQNEIELVNIKDELFDELYKINNKLWILEDIIREKSRNKEFDKQYIKIAESIHKTNDERSNIKKKINIKYKSKLIEEKNNKEKIEKIIYDKNDYIKLNYGKKCYSDGEYIKSYDCISNLVKKYKNYDIYNSFYVELLFSYNIICGIFNYENKYKNKINYIIENLDNLFLDSNLETYCKSTYCTMCLSDKIYNNKYLNHINPITGPNVNKDNMSFFKENDENKTLLIYDGGGIGDTIMFSRFIPNLCSKYKNNNIILFVNDNIKWLLDNCFKNITNINIIPYSKSNLIININYHCNLIKVMYYLNIDYKNITFEPLFKNINYVLNEKNKLIIDKIKKCNKKTYILNWKGNPKNSHEKYNRRMSLNNAIPLFELDYINWIIITKNITSEEREILNKYNIENYGDILDNGYNCFEDSIGIIKNVDGVISTDTSLIHLSANFNIKSYVLLTLGCEWRWTPNDKTTNWYPNTVLIRQNKLNNWNSVINILINHIKT